MYTLYKDGYGPLKEDEYLLKVIKAGKYESKDVGFLTKFTQKNEIPKSFIDWRHTYNDPIYIYNETYKEGWKIYDWRFGQSQNWARLIHPEGFLIEIYLTNLLDLLLKYSVIQGTIIGEFKWSKNYLIHKP